MFLKFKIENFLSINEPVEIDFQCSKTQKLDDTAVQTNNAYINKIACLVGPNAAGKTNILRSFVYFSSFVRDSYLGVPLVYFPHFFAKGKPSSFEVELISEEKRYKYNVTFNNEKILSENLWYFNDNTKRYISVFSRDGSDFSCKINMNETDEKRLSSNVTLFSLLKHLKYFESNGYKGEAFPPVLNNVSMLYDIATGLPEFAQLEKFAKELYEKPDILKELNKEAQRVDFGIEEISVEKVNGAGNPFPDKETKTLRVLHKYKDQEAKIPIFLESSGTRNYIKLYTKIKEILDSGSILIADELEASLHIDLVERILSLFMRKETNPNNAQILFTTHNPWFLQYLTKSQIFIAQKQDNLSTECFRLDEVNGVRNDENFFMKYISGEYDGKPRIKED